MTKRPISVRYFIIILIVNDLELIFSSVAMFVKFYTSVPGAKTSV